jgi:hypothetical protein
MGLLLLHRARERSLRQALERAHLADQQPSRFVLSAEGYAVVQPNRAQTWRWPQVTQLVVLDELVIFRNEGGGVQFVAGHLFGRKEDYDQFTAFLVKSYNEQGPPPSR